jgi:major membrane immunogen (membrane-anchored lipoprotein)
MKKLYVAGGVAVVVLMFGLAACTSQEAPARKPAAVAPAPAPAAKAAAAPAKAKVIKAKGDVGLLDTEKNYLILVTKDGKLVTLDFDAKTKVTKFSPRPGKIADIGLGSSATVTYESASGKNVATKLEYRAKKGE